MRVVCTARQCQHNNARTGECAADAITVSPRTGKSDSFTDRTLYCCDCYKESEDISSVIETLRAIADRNPNAFAWAVEQLRGAYANRNKDNAQRKD